MSHPLMYRSVVAWSAAILTVGIAGCGDAEKSPDAKASVLAASAASKGGPSDIVMISQLTTAMLNGEAEKGTSSIGPGQSVQGELGAGDGTLEDGSYFDSWLFVIGEDSDFSLTMTSSSFDTYLALYEGAPGAFGDNLGSNDDAEGTNSGLQGSLAAGTYTALANSYAAGAVGPYSLTLQVTGGGAEGSRVLRPGRTVSGSLSGSDEMLGDGSYYQDWALMGQGGDNVTVTLRSSDFDAYLMVRQGGDIIESDDDSGGGTDSSITFTLPSTGTYTVRANTFVGGETGGYTLTVESGGSAVGFAGFGSGGDPNGRYALLVGIDDYPGTGSDLRGPVEDARIMWRTLTERFGFDPANIVTLNDSDATRANIAQGIVQHLGQAGPDGVAVFFYSGHGTQIGEHIGLTGSLDPEPRGDGDEAIYIYGHSSQSSIILDEELGYLIETIDAGRAMVVVDACFSGEITRASGDAPQSKVIDINDSEVADNLRLPTNFITSELKALELDDMSLGFGDFGDIARVFRNPQRHIAWGASTEDQVSWTSSLGNGASVFAYFVGQHLMSAPGSMTLSQLSSDVHDDVVLYIERNGNMTMQNPSMRGPNQNMTIDDFFRQR